jgi:predicted transcriptional regulator
MSTTTIRLEEDLKGRLAAVASRAGTRAHAFIVEAIAKSVEQAELDDEFHRVAEQRWAQLLVTGESVPWDDAKAYLEARARGESVPRPQARRPARKSDVE